MEEKKSLAEIELRAYRLENNVLYKVPCSESDNKQYAQMLANGEKLPEGVYRTEYANGETSNTFYTIGQYDMPKDELYEYLFYKQNKLLKIIKNCCIFFTVLAIISIISSIINAIRIASILSIF